jgi:hypothetical protein
MESDKKISPFNIQPHACDVTTAEQAAEELKRLIEKPDKVTSKNAMQSQ